MNKLLLTTRLFPLAILILLSACSDGGGNGNGVVVQTEETTTEETTTEETTVGTDGIVYGNIDGFGSMFVNGRKFSTDQANFFRDGVSAGESDFQVGDLVTIRGSLDPNGNTGTASSVSYQENVIGPITRTWKNNSMEVLGQTIKVDSFSALKGIFLLDELPLGAIIEVTGIVDGNGIILASRMIKHVDAFGSAVPSKVSGILKGLDPSAQTFTIGNLNVDYSGANLLDVPGNGLANGLEIRVTTTQTISGNVLRAETVQVFGGIINGSENDKVEIVGFINGLDTSGNFSIGTQPVQILSTTKLTNGTSGDISDGTQAEVEGRLDKNGVLIAEEVVFRPTDEIFIFANVNAVDLENSTITALGTTATVNNLTRRTDKTGATTRIFGLADVNLGDGIEIFGFINGAGTFVATRLKRYGPVSIVVIRGLAENPDPAGDTVGVAGTTIFLQSDTRYEDVNNDPTTKEAFFAAIVPGVTIIKAEGTTTGINSFTASGIRIK